MSKKISTNQIKNFQKIVRDYYEPNGRDLPWRKTKDPYAILVSEIMLQQTQASRVIGKYEEFMKTFPDVKTLAEASLREVMKAWQGLGYNKRARLLNILARTLIAECGGIVPQTPHDLMKLPGIGKATAGAISAYAFNNPVIFIETNIRAVFIHHFFEGSNSIKDSEIVSLVEKTIDRENPRCWYNALMDYGVELKKRYHNPGRRSAAYKKQSVFQGSNRQVRGMILKALMSRPRITLQELFNTIPFDSSIVEKNVFQLIQENLLEKHGDYFLIE